MHYLSTPSNKKLKTGMLTFVRAKFGKHIGSICVLVIINFLHVDTLLGFGIEIRTIVLFEEF